MTTTNEGTQRDDLARELFIADNSNQPREASIVDWEWFEGAGKQRGQTEHYHNMAVGMIAAGYRKPRTITTVEELDALPEGTQIVDACERLALEETSIGCLEWVDRHGNSCHVELPAIVLHEPEAEVGA